MFICNTTTEIWAYKDPVSTSFPGFFGMPISSVRSWIRNRKHIRIAKVYQCYLEVKVKVRLDPYLVDLNDKLTK